MSIGATIIIFILATAIFMRVAEKSRSKPPKQPDPRLKSNDTDKTE